MPIQIDEGLRTRIPGVKFGIARFQNLIVQAKDDILWKMIEELGASLIQSYKLDGLSGNTHIAAVRNLQKAFGFDPTRYRPSSEALLRRLLKGQGLYQINTAVDVNNLCSLKYLLPICVYDLKQVQGNIQIRLGEAGETYPGIGRQTFLIEEKVIIADQHGVIGNTVSDSERTKVTEMTHELLMVIHMPASYSLKAAEEVLMDTTQKMLEFNQGHLLEQNVLVI